MCAQDPNAPFPHVFQEIGWIEIKWIVTIGAIFALCTCLLGAIFPLPRVLYAMATDGILFKGLRKINARTQTPLVATIYSGLLAATMALIFDLHQLIDMMSIGTLLAYTIVSICVLVLRYQCDETAEAVSLDATGAQVLRQLVNANSIKHANHLTTTIVKSAVVGFSVASIIMCSLLELADVTVGVTAAMAIVGAALLLFMLIIARQPVSDVRLTFKVPLVPWIPCLSVLINLYLMFQLDMQTWIRFGIWGAIGKCCCDTFCIRI